MTDTRQRLIEAAHNLFYRHGFLAVGLDRVLDAITEAFRGHATTIPPRKPLAFYAPARISTAVPMPPVKPTSFNLPITFAS